MDIQRKKKELDNIIHKLFDTKNTLKHTRTYRKDILNNYILTPYLFHHKNILQDKRFVKYSKLRKLGWHSIYLLYVLLNMLVTKDKPLISEEVKMITIPTVPPTIPTIIEPIVIKSTAIDTKLSTPEEANLKKPDRPQLGTAMPVDTKIAIPEEASLKRSDRPHLGTAMSVDTKIATPDYRF